MSHKIFNHSRGDTRQILNNLREEDNLRREDKSVVPKVSSLRRFHCITVLTIEGTSQVMSVHFCAEFWTDFILTATFIKLMRHKIAIVYIYSDFLPTSYLSMQL